MWFVSLSGPVDPRSSARVGQRGSGSTAASVWWLRGLRGTLRSSREKVIRLAAHPFCLLRMTRSHFSATRKLQGRVVRKLFFRVQSELVITREVESL